MDREGEREGERETHTQTERDRDRDIVLGQFLHLLSKGTNISPIKPRKDRPLRSIALALNNITKISSQVST
jgi:hypothetical protein